MKKILLAITLIFCAEVNAQTAPATSFNRPSMTSLFISSNYSAANKVYAAFSKLPMEERFDNREVRNPNLRILLPSEPILQQTGDAVTDVKLMKEHRFAMREWKDNCIQIVSESINPIGREVFGNMLSRQQDGNMSYTALMAAAKYSATDNDALTAGASKNSDNAYQKIAEDLLNKVYFTLYDIKSIKTMEEKYDEIDAAGRAQQAKANDAAAKADPPRAQKEYVPVKRPDEGWFINYDYRVYRLVWNDSIMSLFSDVWLDESITDSRERMRRKIAFENFKFPYELVMNNNSDAYSTQPKDNPNATGLDAVLNALVIRKSMDELLTQFPKNMQDGIISKGSRKIDDFKIRAPLFQETPPMVKLGTKEGIYLDERFFAYEMIQDDKGNKVKKKIGVLRVKEIADNSIIADGTSPASRFSQQGGKSLYNGTLVELKHDRGFGGSLGFGNNPLVGGVVIGLEARISQIFKSKSKKSFMNGMYLNGYISSSNMDSAEFKSILNDQFKVFQRNVSSLSLSATLAKEVYISKRGNLYLLPELGVGISSTTIDRFFNTDSLNGCNVSNTFVYFGLGAGFHLSPTVSISARVGVNKFGKNPSWSGQSEQNDNSLSNIYSDQEWQSSVREDHPLYNLNRTVIPFSISLRIRI
jgi:hypothetical protein